MKPKISHSITTTILGLASLVGFTPGFAMADDATNPPRFIITDLGAGHEPQSISDAGLVVGKSFLWQDGQVTDLPDMPGYVCTARSVNSSGLAVGDCSKPAEDNHAVFWADDGSIVDLGTLNSKGAYVTGINNDGMIVGITWSEKYGELRAFECDKRGLIYRRLLGEPIAKAVGVNNRGDVVGRYGEVANETQEGNRDAILWHDGKVTDLGDFEPTAINDNGAVVGNRNFAPLAIGGAFRRDSISDLHEYAPAPVDNKGPDSVDSRSNPLQTAGGYFGGYGWSSPAHAVIWVDGKLTSLSTPGFDFAFARGINNAGDIVGCAYDKLSTAAVLWRNGQCFDLNQCVVDGSDWKLSVANAINSNGRIVGEGTHSGVLTGFLLTPVVPAAAVEQPAKGGRRRRYR